MREHVISFSGRLGTASPFSAHQLPSVFSEVSYHSVLMSVRSQAYSLRTGEMASAEETSDCVIFTGGSQSLNT